MTPQFITQCFVRVEDADKRKEVCKELERIGYELFNQINILDVDAMTVFTNAIYSDGTPIDDPSYAAWPHRMISLFKFTHTDCGTNIELFLTLASMSSDTDKGQWFTDSEIMWQCPYDEFTGNVYMSAECPQFEPDKIRCATAAEIIEHFKSKTK